MTKTRKIVAAVAGAGLVVLVGIAAAPQQAPPQLKLDDLASPLQLTPQVKKQVAPQVDQLNTLLVRVDKARQERQQLWTQFADVQGKIAQDLTPQQRQQFAIVLGQAWGHGMGGGYMGAGHMGYGRMGPGAMGYGQMGHRHMGYGRVTMGGMGGYWGGMHGGMRGWNNAPQNPTPPQNPRGPRR